MRPAIGNFFDRQLVFPNRKHGTPAEGQTQEANAESRCGAGRIGLQALSASMLPMLSRESDDRTVPRLMESRNGRIPRFSTVEHSARLARSSWETREVPTTCFEPQHRNKAHSMGISGILKAQHGGECCGCSSTRSPRATAAVALLRLTNPTPHRTSLGTVALAFSGCRACASPIGPVHQASQPAGRARGARAR